MPKREPENGYLELLGEAALVALAEAFGGTRLLVPARLPDDHAIVRAVGREAASKLAEAFSPDVIRVPLAREQRASHYRRQGLSNAKTASRLGVTETSIDKLFKRLRERS